MLLYKNGRFYAPYVSFALPDDILVETEPTYCYQYGLTACTPDRRYEMDWQVELGCLGTERELAVLFTDEAGYTPRGQIEPVAVNGLTGHQAYYRDAMLRHMETRLDLGHGAEMVFHIWTGKADLAPESLPPQAGSALRCIRPEK